MEYSTGMHRPYNHITYLGFLTALFVLQGDMEPLGKVVRNFLLSKLKISISNQIYPYLLQSAKLF